MSKDAAYRFVDAPDGLEPAILPWTPLLVPKEAIDREIERLAAMTVQSSHARVASIIHPQSTEPGLGLAPGVDVKINVLKPGEETQPLRCNSNQVEFCLRGEGRVTSGGREISASKWDVWNIPSMKPHWYRNDGTELFVRLTYSNTPLLKKLGVYFAEKGEMIRAEETSASNNAPANTFTRELAPEFAVTPDGATLRGYEYLVDIQVVDNELIHWRWERIEPHMPAVPGDKKRNIMLLYNPATERRNGTTHSFFATIAVTAPGTPPRPRGRGHRHSSVAINYHFKGSGSSVVDDKEFHWKAGDLMLSAPAWSEHAHYPGPEGHGILTIQDHPLQIGMESLIWQERMGGPILTLGSECGQTGFVGPRQQGTTSQI